MKYTYFDQQARKVQKIKEEYPKGTRILLEHMDVDKPPIPDNTYGTVKGVDDIGTIHVLFDNNRNRGVIPGVDKFHKLTESEYEDQFRAYRTKTG